MIRKGLLRAPRLDHEWVLGANSQIERGEALESDRQWDSFLPQQILQRNNLNQDFYICVTASALNIIETLIKKQYGEDVVFSRRFTAVMSGTVPYRGNSLANVWDSILRDGLVLEADWPTDPNMTVSQFFAKPTANVIAKGKLNKNIWFINHEYLPSNTIDDIMNALLFSPIQACVSGDYARNNQGEIIRVGTIDDHAVEIFGYQATGDLPFKIFDSESLTNELFVQNYGFDDLKIVSVKKNSMKLYKQTDKPAIYALDPETNQLVPFSDGSVAGGKVLKTTYGVISYSQLPITVVDTLPFPVASWALTSSNFDPNSIGSLTYSDPDLNNLVINA